MIDSPEIVTCYHCSRALTPFDRRRAAGLRAKGYAETWCYHCGHCLERWIRLGTPKVKRMREQFAEKPDLWSGRLPA